MPVSGLVVSLAHDAELREEAMATIRREPRIEIGAIKSGRMAVVMDTGSAEDDKQLWCWLSSLPGVVFVDVAMVGFDGPHEIASTPCDRRAIRNTEAAWLTENSLKDDLEDGL